MYNIHPEFQRVKRKETTCCCWIYLTKDSGNTAVRKYIIHLKNLTLFHILFAQSCKKKKEKKEGGNSQELLKKAERETVLRWLVCSHNEGETRRAEARFIPPLSTNY